ncbi:ABC transporter ATP-binding protein [Leifsonia sp. NPDC077715]|uniref:ABC transporter ATP-binding protein n=1 Tax=Leifsonia sp. NPDC077715 TaxID=3155539 RepID=UPI0034363272
MTRLLDIQDVTLALHEKTLLDGVSLHVEAGETVAVVGESGSGKSLTARLALGLRPSGAQAGGTLRLGDVEMLTATPAEILQQRRTFASMIFQDPRAGINPMYRVGAFLREALVARGAGHEEAGRRSAELVEAMRLPPESLDRYPHQFSGGMLQRIMIAGALTTSPSLLLCDEPTTALDVTTQAEIIRLLASLTASSRMGMLFITHDLNLAAELASRVYVMRGGRIVEEGATADVFAHPQAEYTRMLLAATPSLDGPAVPAPAEAGRCLVRFSDVEKSYRVGRSDVPALRGVSFELRRGEALGVVGESGSGKSTVARLLVGLEEPTAGTIELPRDAVLPRGRAGRLQRAAAVQIVFQDPYLSLDPRITVHRAIGDVLLLHGKCARGGVREQVLRLLHDVGLPEAVLELTPRALSGGQRQRVALAKALAVEPELLVLDEATSALDVSVQAQLLALLADLRTRRDLTLVFISHNLAVMRETCDRLIVMREGVIVEAAPTGEILRHPREEYTRRLLDAVPSDHATVVKQAGPGV